MELGIREAQEMDALTWTPYAGSSRREQDILHTETREARMVENDVYYLGCYLMVMVTHSSCAGL